MSSNINQPLFVRESERNKGIKLVLKIFGNIQNNPSQIEKYGDLHARKINDKLNKCKPALNLLYIAGFKKSNDSTRLIWTNNNNNMESLKYIHQTLQSIMNTETITSNSKKEKGTLIVRDTNDQWRCKICTFINNKISTHCAACSNPTDFNNTHDDIEKLVLSLMKQNASQVLF